MVKLYKKLQVLLKYFLMVVVYAFLSHKQEENNISERLSHFNRVFKEMMGCTPTEFRNSNGKCVDKKIKNINK